MENREFIGVDLCLSAADGMVFLYIGRAILAIKLLMPKGVC
jgi:hypothetical protein